MNLCEDANEYNSTQAQILKQFRKNLSDILTPDVSDKVLLKWLRAKNFNLAKCEELYRVYCRIKTVLQVDQLEEIWEIPEVILKYEFSNHVGYAKDGTPVYYISLGRGDLRGFLMSIDIYSIGKYCAMAIEKDMKRCKEQSKKLGKEINEITYIFDMEYFSLRQLFSSGIIQLGFDLMRLLQDYFPEIWNYAFVVNAPFFVETVFNTFRPIFGNTLLQKIHIVSRSRTPSLLLKYIDPEVLPAFLGGKRVDSTGDPMCSEFMKFGGIISEKYYLRNQSPLLPTDKGVEDVWLLPKCVHNCIVLVREANSIFRIEVRTEGGSLPAVMLYRKFGPDLENLDLPGIDENLDPADKRCNVVQCAPYLHLQTHISPIDNYCAAPWPGIYIFKFDNSYNWISTRRCIYRIRVLPPDSLAMLRKKVGSEEWIHVENVKGKL